MKYKYSQDTNLYYLVTYYKNRSHKSVEKYFKYTDKDLKIFYKLIECFDDYMINNGKQISLSMMWIKGWNKYYKRLKKIKKILIKRQILVEER